MFQIITLLVESLSSGSLMDMRVTVLDKNVFSGENLIRTTFVDKSAIEYING